MTNTELIAPFGPCMAAAPLAGCGLSGDVIARGAALIAGEAAAGKTISTMTATAVTASSCSTAKCFPTVY